MNKKIGRNDPCPCGSGKKYKKCCLGKDELSTTSINYTWQKIRVIENKVLNLLIPYAKERYGEDSLIEAWEEFTVWSGDDYAPLEEPEFETMFKSWFYFNWEPDNAEEDPEYHLPEEKIAMLYMKEHGHKLDPYDKKFIEVACNSEFSFYKVVNIFKDKSIILKDVFSGKEYTIYERQGTHCIQLGYIVYARIITIDGTSVQFGIAPYLIPPTYGMGFIDFKEEHIKKGGRINADFYHEYDLELRDMYWFIRSDLLKPPEMKLANTDGDKIVWTKLTYELKCSIDEAFDGLRVLSLGNTKRELLQDAEVDDNGKLKHIEFSWIKKGNKKHESWKSTIMGHINLDEKSFTVEVNSEERSMKVQQKIERLLGDKVKFKHRTIESLQNKLDEVRNNPKALQKKKEYDDLNEAPEVKDFLKNMMVDHWKKWVDSKIPALKNQTPKEAAKSEFGRERLETLFAEFEITNNKTSEPHLKVPVDELRSKIGM